MNRAMSERLTDELSSEQLMGLKLDIVNPVLWEIGHVGWFHEYWTLRHSHGQAPLIDRADDLWNSSTVAHDTRWSLDLPDRDATFAYLAEVLEHQCDQLTCADFPEPALYFYELAVRRGHARRSTDLHARNARLSAAAESWRSCVGCRHTLFEVSRMCPNQRSRASG
jgi:hypothetical protein